MRKPVLLILVLLSIVISLSIVRIYVTNHLASSGVVLEEIQQELSRLETENASLSQNLYEESSLTKLFEKAKEIGYVKDGSVYAVSSYLPIASRR